MDNVGWMHEHDLANRKLDITKTRLWLDNEKSFIARPRLFPNLYPHTLATYFQTEN